MQCFQSPMAVDEKYGSSAFIKGKVSMACTRHGFSKLLWIGEQKVKEYDKRSNQALSCECRNTSLCQHEIRHRDELAHIRVLAPQV